MSDKNLDNINFKQDWLKNLLESDSECQKRRKETEPMSDKMQDLLTEMDERTSYISPDNDD